MYRDCLHLTEFARNVLSTSLLTRVLQGMKWSRSWRHFYTERHIFKNKMH